jgi:tetratricopeptide (TPR) repeat protein
MATRARSIIALVACLASTASAAPAKGQHKNKAPAQPSDQSADTARNGFELGQKLFDEGKYKEAIEAFKAAEALRADPAFDYDIATCYRRLGDNADAIDYLKQTLREAPASSPWRDRAAADLGDLVANQPATQPEAPSTSPTTAGAAAPWTERPSRTPAYVVAGATALLVASSITFAVFWNSADNRLHNYPSTAAEADSDLSSAHFDGPMAIGLGAASAVGAAVTTWLWIRSSGRTDEPSAVQVQGAVLPGGAALSISGGFGP